MGSVACTTGPSYSFLRFLGMLLAGSTLMWWGCGTQEVRPVELYPEDMCALCRMAVSDHRFAAEIVTRSGEALKFDDIGCLERFMDGSKDLQIAGVFVKNYETKEWLPRESAVVIVTDVMTPMGSGKLAFADSSLARRWLESRAAAGPAEGDSTTHH